MKVTIDTSDIEREIMSQIDIDTIRQDVISECVDNITEYVTNDICSYGSGHDNRIRDIVRGIVKSMFENGFITHLENALDAKIRGDICKNLNVNKGVTNDRT